MVSIPYINIEVISMFKCLHLTIWMSLTMRGKVMMQYYNYLPVTFPNWCRAPYDIREKIGINY